MNGAIKSNEWTCRYKVKEYRSRNLEYVSVLGCNLTDASFFFLKRLIGNKLPQDALNPAHASLLQVNSHSNGTLFNHFFFLYSISCIQRLTPPNSRKCHYRGLVQTFISSSTSFLHFSLGNGIHSVPLHTFFFSLTGQPVKGKINSGNWYFRDQVKELANR